MFIGTSDDCSLTRKPINANVYLHSKFKLDLTVAARFRAYERPYGANNCSRARGAHIHTRCAIYSSRNDTQDRPAARARCMHAYVYAYMCICTRAGRWARIRPRASCIYAGHSQTLIRRRERVCTGANARPAN